MFGKRPVLIFHIHVNAFGSQEIDIGFAELLARLEKFESEAEFDNHFSAELESQFFFKVARSDESTGSPLHNDFLSFLSFLVCLSIKLDFCGRVSVSFYRVLLTRSSMLFFARVLLSGCTFMTIYFYILILHFFPADFFLSYNIVFVFVRL